MNALNVKENNERVFQQMARWECECSANNSTYAGCGKRATHVIEWRHQDGDRERRILCQEHAVDQEKYWSAMDWHTGVEVSDIEGWVLNVRYGGKTATRVGKGVPGNLAPTP